MKKKNFIKINYPNSFVFFEGKDRIKDIKSLLYQGQGVNGAIDFINQIIKDSNRDFNTDFLKGILLGIIKQIEDYEKQRKEIFVEKEKILTPGTYICINSKRRIVRSKLEIDINGNQEWEMQDILLVFPFLDPNSLDNYFTNF